MRGLIDELARLAAEKASGELIVAAGAAELHVYMQEGRLAWATSSTTRLAFSKHLVAHCGLDPATLKEVVVECQRSRRPVGETLIEWQLVAASQVREALFAQVTTSLSSFDATTCGPVQHLFLPRGNGYQAYDAALTFALGEVRAALDPTTDNGDAAQALLTRLAARLPDALWWRLLGHDGKVTEQLRSEAAAPPPALDQLVVLLQEPVIGIACRGVPGMVVGARLREGGGDLWVGVPDSSGAGLVERALRDCITPTEPAAVDGGSSRQTAGEPGADLGAALENLLDQSSGVLGAGVVDRRGRLEAMCRPGLDPVRVSRLVRRSELALEAPLFADFPRRRVTGNIYGLDERTLRITERGATHLLYRVAGSQETTVWLTIDPEELVLGMGWGLLTTLGRRVRSEPLANE